MNHNYDMRDRRDVLRHWFALQDPNTGWIAREQILGKEARSKVPPEFQAQNPSYANPPTLLFPLSASIQAIKKAQGALSALSLSFYSPHHPIGQRIGATMA